MALYKFLFIYLLIKVFGARITARIADFKVEVEEISWKIGARKPLLLVKVFKKHWKAHCLLSWQAAEYFDESFDKSKRLELA